MAIKGVRNEWSHDDLANNEPIGHRTRTPFLSVVRAGVPHRSNGYSVQRPSMLRLKRLRMYDRTNTHTITFRGGWHAPGSSTH